MADTLQCNLWRRAQTPHRMTHRLHGSDNQGNYAGFTALGKTIRTRKSNFKDSEYVNEHSVLKYVRKKMACYLQAGTNALVCPCVSCVNNVQTGNKQYVNQIVVQTKNKLG